MAGEAGSGWRLPASLPPIRGGMAVLYGLVWLALLALFAVGTIGVSLQNLRNGAGISYSWAPLGLDVDRDDDDRPYRVVTAAASARAAGVQPGDLVLRVDGIDIAAATDRARPEEVQRDLLKPEGAAVRLMVRTGAATPRTIVLRHRAANAIDLYAPSGLTPRSMTWANVTLFALSPGVLFVGAACLVRRRREPLAAILSISLLALAGVLGNQIAFWVTIGIPFVAVWVPASCLGLSGIYLMALTFPAGRFAPRWTALLALGFPILVVLANFVPGFAWLLVAWVLAGIGLMIMRYRGESVEERRQWRWAMLGLAAGALILLVGEAGIYQLYVNAHPGDLAIELWTWIVTPAITAVIAALVVGGLVLSVLRYRLYDTQAAVSRSLVYATLTILLVAIFAGSEKTVEIIGEDYFGERIGALAGGLGAAFAAVTIGPLHHRVSHWSEHLLRRDLVHLRQDLPPLLLEAAETEGTEAVARLLIESVAHGLHVTCAALVDGQHVLAAHGVASATVAAWREGAAAAMQRVDERDPLFPVRLPLARRADRWLLVGARPDGTLVGKDERQLLDDLARPIADALRLARHQGGEQERMPGRMDDLERRLAAIETAVGARTARATSIS